MSSFKSEQSQSGRWPITAAGLELSRGGRRLFSGMTWELPPGKLLVVTGPSGAGKTSLLACLRGILRPQAGSVSIPDGPRAAVGVVFQHLRLTGNLSVLSNVLCGRLGHHRWWETLFGFPAAEREQAFDIIAELGLAGLVHRPVRSISGGERQRTAIARVLFQDPAVILADEPTSSLDPQLALRVMERFRTLCDKKERTVIAVLHDRAMVERFADLELRLGFENGGWEISEPRRG